MARPTLMRHRKFIRLTALLGAEYIARGVLEMLWDGAYDSGDDRLGNAAEIELRVHWQGEPGALAAALVTSGFIDQDGDILRVHDLWHHAPDYVKRRRKRESERIAQITPSVTDRSVTGKRRSVTDKVRSRTTGNVITPSPSPSPALEIVKSVCAEPAESADSTPPDPPSPTVLTFPTIGTGPKTWDLTEAEISELQADFPSLDVRAQCRHAHAWIRGMPSRRKTARGMRRFLVSWLGRETNRWQRPQARDSPADGRAAIDHLRAQTRVLLADDDETRHRG